MCTQLKIHTASAVRKPRVTHTSPDLSVSVNVSGCCKHSTYIAAATAAALSYNNVRTTAVQLIKYRFFSRTFGKVGEPSPRIVSGLKIALFFLFHFEGLEVRVRANPPCLMKDKLRSTWSLRCGVVVLQCILWIQYHHRWVYPVQRSVEISCLTHSRCSMHGMKWYIRGSEGFRV